MELASIAFRQIVTMIILMVIGVVCAKIKLVDENTNKKLSSLILLLINPLIIFLSYQRKFEPELMGGLFISLALAVVSFAISLSIAHIVYRNKNGKDYAIDKYAAVYSNSGFIGIPLVQGIFGLEGVFYLTAYLTVFNIIVWTHGVIVMSGVRNFSSIKKAIVSPALIAVFLGFLSFFLKVELPEIILAPLSMLGNTNTPLAMIVAGVTVSQMQPLKIIKNFSIYKLSVIRLVIIPLFVIAVFTLLCRLIPISQIIIGTSIIAVSCPVAANIILFAYRYDRDHLYASELFVTTTLLSMISIPLLLFLI